MHEGRGIYIYLYIELDIEVHLYRDYRYFYWSSFLIVVRNLAMEALYLFQLRLRLI
jgi:hypothetical protein